MNEPTLKPEKITKPIQLLAAWLAGLFSIDACFLFAAARMQTGSWESGALTIAAIINVPLFLTAVFLLQTRFRPELQEDSYYSTYLSKKTNEPITISKDDGHLAQLRQRLAELEDKISAPVHVVDAASADAGWPSLQIGVNRHLSDRPRIGSKLSELGVLAFTSFGSDEPPKERLVALSGKLSKEQVIGIVRVAKDLGFTGYSFFDSRDEDIEEDVLFGSYGGSDHDIAGVEA